MLDLAVMMATTEPKDGELRERSLFYSLRDGMAWSVMVGFGDHYLGAFALLLLATPFQMGLLVALPPITGALFQLWSARLTDRSGRRRNIIVTSAGLQSLVWILIFLVPMSVPREWAVPFMIFFVVCFVVGGHFTVPPWYSLMGDLVDPSHRGDYFGRRNRICQFFTFVSVGLAGLVLHYFEKLGPGARPYGFMVIFGVACAARLISTVYLSLQYEPPYAPPPREKQIGFPEFLRSLGSSNFGRFGVFSAAMSFAVHLSAPFFVVYLLRDLGLNYIRFTIVTSMVVLAHILTLVFWGRAADRFGNKWVLTTCGLIFSVGPLCLPLSTEFWFIVAFQFVMAVAGAGFNLASANYLFDAAPPPQRARYVAFIHVLNASGVFLGGLAGGWLAGRMPPAIAWGPVHFNLASGLLMLFLISGLLRLVILAAFRSRFQELRSVDPAPRPVHLFRLAVVEMFSFK